MDERPDDRGDDPGQPPAQASSALRRLVAEIAQEVAGAKERAREPIVQKVEQLSEWAADTAQPLPHLERAAQELAAQHMPTLTSTPSVLKEVLSQLPQAMPRARGDRDARMGHTSRGEQFCGYVSGNVVDGKSEVITATHLEVGNRYAPSGLTESGVAEQHVKRRGHPPDQAALDAAFDQPEVRQHLRQVWPTTTTYIHPAPLPTPSNGVLGSGAFTLTPDDNLLCPNPQVAAEAAVMRLIQTKPDGTRVYEGRACETCHLRPPCTTKTVGPRTVTLNPELHRQRLAALEAARSEEHRAAIIVSSTCWWSSRSTWRNRGAMRRAARTTQARVRCLSRGL